MFTWFLIGFFTVLLLWIIYAVCLWSWRFTSLFDDKIATPVVTALFDIEKQHRAEKAEAKRQRKELKK